MSLDESKIKEKIKVYQEWIKGDHILVHIDSSRDEVIVPQHLKGNKSLTLKLSYLFQGETKHNEQEISSFLRFRGQYFECILPWVAIWGITDENGETQIWPDELPIDVLKNMVIKQVSKKEVNPNAAAESKEKPKLKLASSEKDNQAPTKESKTVPFLKRIK
ncbi:MAG: hypothetical protein KBC84_02310 [Proteobacteria bacterium]|nr:hypothetical protein [Pseudomonadota bacterium]